VAGMKERAEALKKEGLKGPSEIVKELDAEFRKRTVIRARKKTDVNVPTYTRAKVDPLAEILDGIPPNEVWDEIKALQEDHEDCPGAPVLKASIGSDSKKKGIYLCSVCSRLDRK
jgi:hypothetical protein